MKTIADNFKTNKKDYLTVFAIETITILTSSIISLSFVKNI